MKYHSLTLTGYIPLLLNGVAEFSMLVEKDEQILLGSNGSAKSSVMRELSPLPATKADYTKDGKKVIVLEDKGIVYTLTSDFTSGTGKHTFVKGEEVLNDAGNGMVQTALVKQHLGYDSELHELMTDAVRFTRMTPQQRQHWITRISGADFSFAISLFKELKSDLRDAQGALKNVNQKLASLVKTGVDQDADLRRIDDTIQSVLLEIERLNQAKPFSSEQEANQAKDNALQQFDLVSREIAAYTAKHYSAMIQQIVVLRQRYQMDKRATLCDNVSYLNGVVRDKETDLAIAKEKLRTHKEEYARIASVVEQIESLGVSGIHGIETSIRQLAEHKAGVREKLDMHPLLDLLPESARAASVQFDVVKRPLQAALQQLPLNEDKSLSLAALHKVLADIKELESKRAGYNVQLEKIQHRLNHIESAHAETCPKCQTSFIPGVSDTDKATLIARQEKGEALVKEVNARLAELHDEKERQEAFQQHLAELRQLFQQAPLCRMLFNRMVETGMAEGNTADSFTLLMRYESLLLLQAECDETASQLAFQSDALKKLKALPIPEGNMAQVSATAESSLQVAVERLELAEREYAQAKEDESQLVKMAEYLAHVDTLSERLCNAHKDVSNATRMDGIAEALKHHYGWLTALYDEKRVLSTAADLIADYTNEQKKLEGKIATLSLLVDELSPKSGLIADVILRFINEFVATMNDVIQAVWTYDMRMIAPSMDDESAELDYKFPLQVRNSPRPVKDILMASAGQEDMINFAFKVAALGFMGCSGIPLMLDELSPHLDETHRILITQYVAKMLGSNRCSQLFMISHFQAGHGAFVNAQYCVMDPTNITLPTVYNEHVTFTKVA